MKLTFYKNLEFTLNRYTYHLSEGQEKGLYYVHILNQIDSIIKWLENFLLLVEKNKTDFLYFPRFRGLDIMFLNLIKTSLLDDFNCRIKSLSERKEVIKFLEENTKKNNNNSVLETYKNSLNKLDKLIKDKLSVKNNTNKIIDILKYHKIKVDYFIVKENILKENISNNKIQYLFSSHIDLPSHIQELYFENNGLLKYIKLFDFDNINLKEKDKTLEFDFLNFNYVDKYNISSVSELLNLYYNEILKDKILIKKCKNCGKYFIAHNKQLYCDNISPQNSSVTCRKLSDDTKEKQDKLYDRYRKSYKTQHNKLNRYIKVGNIPKNTLKERFQNWNQLAIHMKNTCKNANEYNEWYKTSMNWIKS